MGTTIKQLLLCVLMLYYSTVKAQQTPQPEPLSLEVCRDCCAAVRDLDYWVNAQHTGSCNNDGCEDQDCGGFACRVGLNFRQGNAPEFQVDANGVEIGYICIENSATGAGEVIPLPAPTAAPTSFPTTTPTASPTNFPTTPTLNPPTLPTAFPTTAPTRAQTTTPTVSPTSFPTTAPTAAPIAAPTPSPTNRPTVPPIPTTSPTQQPTQNSTDAPTVLNSRTEFPTVDPTGSGGFGIWGIIGTVVAAACLIPICALAFVSVFSNRERGRAIKKHRQNKERRKRNKKKGVAEEIDPDAYDEDGRVKSGVPLVIQLRNNVWYRKENVFSDDVKVSVHKKDYKGQTRKSLAIPIPPHYEAAEEEGKKSERGMSQNSKNKHKSYTELTNPRKSYGNTRLSQAHASFKINKDILSSELENELWNYEEEARREAQREEEEAAALVAHATEGMTGMSSGTDSSSVDIDIDTEADTNTTRSLYSDEAQDSDVRTTHSHSDI